MRYSHFKKYIKTKSFASGKLLIDLKKLEIYPSKQDKRIVLAKDPRSFKKDGMWQIHPIAVNDNQTYIVCPYCGEIHFHGKGEGFRVPHCNTGEDTSFHPVNTENPDYNILNWEE